MRRMMWVAVAGLLAATTMVRGAPLNRSHVDGEARILAHLDFEQFKSTAVGQWFLEELRKPDAENKFAAMKAVFNFDPREDMRSLTFYGTVREEGVLILDGKFDIDRAVTLLKAGQGYSTQSYDGETIHSWFDPKKACGRHEAAAPQGSPAQPNSFAVVMTGGNIVMGEKLASVERAIDVIKGRRPVLSQHSPLSALIPDGNVPVLLAGADLAGLQPRKAKSGTFDGLTSASMTAGEQGGNVMLNVQLEAKDDATAAQIQAVIQGFISLGILSAKDNPEKAALFSRMTCTLNGKAIHLVANLPAADFLKFCQTCKPGDLPATPVAP